MPPASAAKRLGVFGGTFDPIHAGHLITAQDVLEALSLDRILFVPALHSPHKRSAPQASAAARLRMIRGAIDGDPRFEVSDVEIERNGPSYTVETLRAFSARWPASQLVLILGADQWAQFDQWREPREIASRAELVLMTRNGQRPSEVDSRSLDGSTLTFTEVSVTRIDLSATVVRARVREGFSVRYLVPEPVRRIIEAERLYLNGA